MPRAEAPGPFRAPLLPSLPLAFVALLSWAGTAQTITTVALTSADGVSLHGAREKRPPGLEVVTNVMPDPEGNLCFSETNTARVRCIDRKTSLLITRAGNGRPGAYRNGLAAVDVPLSEPREIAFDRRGNLLIADAGNRVVFSVDRKSGVLTTLVGSPAAAPKDQRESFAADFVLSRPTGLTLDLEGNLVIVDAGWSSVLRMDRSTGRVRKLDSLRFGPDESAASTRPPEWLTSPRYDKEGNLYLCSRDENFIARMDRSAGFNAIRVAGSRSFTSSPYGGYEGDDRSARAARLRKPTSLAVDGAGNVFICDGGNHAVRRVDRKTGVITTVAGGMHGAGFSGDGGPAREARLSDPTGIGLDDLGNLYVVDSGNHRIRKIEGIAAR